MNDTIIGLCFFLCLIIGIGMGTIFNSLEVGGIVGLSIGLLFILFFRKRNRRW